MDKLPRIIAREIKHQGPVSFARFMELALYHPELGYYSSERQKIGRAGDFYTAPSVSPLFGQMLARQAEEMWRISGRPEQWALVEYGPGTGKLAGDIMSALGQQFPEFYRTVSYYLVEISPGLRKKQQSELAGHQAASKFFWAGEHELLESGGLQGCVLANEVVDAMPVHLVKMRGGEIKEIFVDTGDDGNFYFVEQAPSTPQLVEYFTMQDVELKEGQVAEVNLQAAGWIERVASFLERGFILVIDYGATAGKLYSDHRYHGTLRCFHKHRLVEDPLVNVGYQDITAHVNFTSLAMQGEKAGLKALGPVSQPQFLLNLGILDTVKEYNSFTYDPVMAKKTMAIKQLVLPGGMGEIFKVLVLYKGFEEKPALTGMGSPAK